MGKKDAPRIPQATSIAGKMHKPLVLLVTASDAHGRPSACQVIYDEDTVHLKGGEAFWVVWAPTEMGKKGN